MSERTTTELQQEFREIVKKMVESKCPLPKDFLLYHCVQEFINSSEHTISVKSFLTQNEARQAAGLNVRTNTKYGHQTTFRVVKGSDDFDVDLSL